MNKILHTHCCYCRRKFSDTVPNLKRTRDHFIAKSRTGKNGENILQCCKECNTFKADKTPSQFLEIVTEHFQRKIIYGTYTIRNYAEIMGSIKHFIKHFKNKSVSDYKKN